MFKSKRLFVNTFVFGTFLFLPMVPWYIPFAIAVWASWYFMYHEILILGVLMDAMFKSDLFFNINTIEFPYPFLVVGGVALITLQLVKKRVRFYS